MNCQVKCLWRKNNGGGYLKAASLTVPGTVGIKEVPSPEPAKGDLLVRIRDLAHALATSLLLTG